MSTKVYARARTTHQVGRMNKTEAARAAHLESLQRGGHIHAFLFEAAKLRLADNTFITLDFLVIQNDGTVDLEDVKGRKGDSYYTTEDARIKIKVAARTFPWFRFYTVWQDRQGFWHREEIQA